LASEGKVEMRLRWDKQNKREVALNEATDEIAAAVQAEKRKLLDEADKYTV